jgi:hypothetical protein
VGEKKSSAAITAEYARADPVYVAKTAVSSLQVEVEPETNCLPESSPDILSLPSDTGRWKLWMAG